MFKSIFIRAALASFAVGLSACSSIKIKDLKFKSVEVADPVLAARETKSQRADEKLLKISFVTRELAPDKPRYKVRVGSCDPKNGEESMMGPVGASETDGYFPNADGSAYHFYIVSAFEVPKQNKGKFASHDFESEPQDVCFKLKHADYIPSYSNTERVLADEIKRTLERSTR